MSETVRLSPRSRQEGDPSCGEEALLRPRPDHILPELDADALAVEEGVFEDAKREAAA
jgi:hypothetical protein